MRVVLHDHTVAWLHCRIFREQSISFKQTFGKRITCRLEVTYKQCEGQDKNKRKVLGGQTQKDPERALPALTVGFWLTQACAREHQIHDFLQCARCNTFQWDVLDKHPCNSTSSEDNQIWQVFIWSRLLNHAPYTWAMLSQTCWNSIWSFSLLPPFEPDKHRQLKCAWEACWSLSLCWSA